MIYRAVYDQIPAKTTYTEYSTRLGEYAKKGLLKELDESTIYYFK